jgi:hypothetical protein
MDIQQALQKYLTDDTACAAAFGPRIFEGAVPTSAGKPFVQYGVTSLLPDLSLDGEIGSATARITYTVGADTASEAISGLHAIRSRLNGVNFVEINGVDVQHILLQEPGLYEVEQPPDVGEELPLYAWAAEFEVYYYFAANDPEQGGGTQGGGGGAGGGVDPDPDDPSLPAWPAFTASAEMVELLQDTGSWDTGVTKRASYALSADYWYADVWITWYPGKFNGTYPSPLTITNWLTGDPEGRTIYEGTLDRVQHEQPGSVIGWYTSLLRAGTAATYADEGIWPVGRALITSDYDAAWFDPSYNTPGDAYDEERGIAYGTAACREVHGREYARLLSTMKGYHPDLSRVYSDNFAARDIVPSLDWSSLALLVQSVNEKQREEFDIAVPIIANLTTHWKTDLRADLDAMADAGLGGWHNEGLAAEHIILASQWTNFVQNIQHWLAKSWPGGGRRYFASNCDSTTDEGFNRVCTISSVTPGATTLDITLTAPHRMSDTSIWRVKPTGFHASLNGNDYAVTPHASDPNRLTLNTVSAAPGSGYTTGTSTLCFFYSGHDVDAGVLHSLRNATDCVRVSYPHGNTQSPLWRTWVGIYGYATGAPEVVSTHSVDLADYGSSGTVTCVKEIRTPFSGGWYLHVDFSVEERRAWWNNGS